MKKIVSLLLIIIVLFGSVCPVLALEPPSPLHKRVSLRNVDELKEWLETESEDNIRYSQSPELFESFRKNGEFLEPYYPEIPEYQLEKIDPNGDELSYTFNKSGVKKSISVQVIDDEYAHLLPDNMIEYLFHTCINSSWKYEERSSEFELYQFTVGDEILKGVLHNDEYHNSYGIYFIKDNFVVCTSIKQETDESENIVFDVLNGLSFKKHTIEDRPKAGGYGDVLISRNQIEGYQGVGTKYTTVSQEEYNTHETIKEFVLSRLHLGPMYYMLASYEIVNEEFVSAVEGTKENPKGIDGKYSYQVKLSLGDAKPELTCPLSVTIKAKEFQDIAELKWIENQVTANVVQAEDSVNQLMIVAYKDNMMLEAKTVDAVGTDEITAQIPEDANRVKAFLWEKPEQPEAQTYKLRSITPTYALSLNPQCPAWELTKNEQGEWE